MTIVFCDASYFAIMLLGDSIRICILNGGSLFWTKPAAPAPGALILTPPVVDVGFDVDDVVDVVDAVDVGEEGVEGVVGVDVDDVEAKGCRRCRVCTHFDATREKFWPSGGNTTLPLT